MLDVCLHDAQGIVEAQAETMVSAWLRQLDPKGAEEDHSKHPNIAFAGRAADAVAAADPAATAAVLADFPAHISYGLTMSHNLRLELASTLQTMGQPPQLALF